MGRRFSFRRDKTPASEIAADEAVAKGEMAKARELKFAELSERNTRDAALWDERVEAMPEYTPRPVCVKCGDSGISVSFSRPVFSHYEPGMSSIYVYYPSFSGEPAPAKHGALSHKCEHCGYTWKTRAADHNRPPEEKGAQD